MDAHADVVLVSPSVTPAVEGMLTLAGGSGGSLRWEARAYVSSDLDGSWYALALTADAAVNAAVAADAEAHRVFCVRADDATDATAWTPASGRHAGLTVAVLAARDPRRAAAVRDGVLDGLRDGSIKAARVRGKMPGVALVGGGPGDPDLITVRGRQLLAEADVVVADRLAPRALLDELGSHVEVIDAAKIPYGRAMAQEHINAAIVAHAKAGRFVVRLKGGDPYVFGRGYEEVLACAEAGCRASSSPASRARSRCRPSRGSP